MTQKPASRLLMGWLATLTAVSFLVPNHYFPWVSFHEEWLAAFAFIPMVAWAAWQSKKIPLLAKVAFSAGLIPVLQWCLGLMTYRGDAIMATAYWWFFALSIVAGAGWVTQSNKGDAENKRPNGKELEALVPLWLAFVLSGIVSFGICIHQWLDLQILAVLIADLPPGGRPFANLAQPNQLASLFLLGLTGVIFLFEARKINKLSATAAALILTAGLVMTQSRTVFAAIIWLLLAFLYINSRCRLRLQTNALLAGITVFGFLTWLWPDINRWLLVSESAASAATRTASDARWIYFQSAADAILIKPWVGFGFQQINLAQRATEANYHATYNFFQSAHNLLLDITLWIGIPLSIALIYFFGRHFYTIARKIEHNLEGVVLIGIGFLLVHSMLEYPLYYTYFLLPVGFLIGALSKNEVLQTTKIRDADARWWTLAPALLCGLVFIQITFEYPQWEKDWRNARYEIQKYTNTEPPAHPSPAILDPIEDLLWFARYKIHENMSEADLNRAKKVVTRQSHTIVLFRYAQMVALNGHADEARYYLRLLCRFHPPAACNQAKKDWIDAGRNQWHLLSTIDFPQTID